MIQIQCAAAIILLLLPPGSLVAQAAVAGLLAVVIASGLALTRLPGIAPLERKMWQLTKD